MARSSETTPFTIVTGFLGAGKTTLLNHLLSARHGSNLAVIVNEFGEVNIDSHLLGRRLGDSVVELTNGCVCCSVREDLLSGLRDLLDKRRNGIITFEHIVMETTGLAHVHPIVQMLSAKGLKESVCLTGVVTVVDVVNISTQLDRFQEAEEQIGMADVIILNKIDLVDDKTLSPLTTRLRAINGMAKIKPCRRAKADTADVLTDPARRIDASVPDPLDRSEHGRSHKAPDGHDHWHPSLEHVRTLAVQLSEPLEHGRAQDWFSYLIMRHAERLLRYKGILNIEGLQSRVVLQGVHNLIEINSDRDWLPDETRETVVVFIGRNLPEQEIRDGLLRCVAGVQPAAEPP